MLEIDNVREFGAFCAQQAKKIPSQTEEDPNIFKILGCAERWGELTVRLTQQYGGPMENNIKLGLDYAQKTEEHPGPKLAEEEDRYDTVTVMAAADVLSRFWKHREAMSKWLSTQVTLSSGVTR